MDETDFREGKDLLVQGLSGLLGYISFLVPTFLIKKIPIGANEDFVIFLVVGILVFMFGAVPFAKMAKYMLRHLGKCQSVSRAHLAWIGFIHGFFFFLSR